MASSAQVEGLAMEQVSGRRQSMRAGLAGGYVMAGVCSFPTASPFKVMGCEASRGRRGWRLETMCIHLRGD